MKTRYFLILLSLIWSFTSCQTPKHSGEMYSYSIEYDEWGGNTLNLTCTVIIDGKHIKIINDGSLPGNKGDILEEGTLMKHQSGVWIIGQTASDEFAPEVGGCSDGPTIIDLENHILKQC